MNFSHSDVFTNVSTSTKSEISSFNNNKMNKMKSVTLPVHVIYIQQNMLTCNLHITFFLKNSQKFLNTPFNFFF